MNLQSVLRLTYASMLSLAVATPLVIPQVAPKKIVERADAAKPAAEKPAGPLTPVEFAEVKNALKWSDNIYSGSCPHGEAGYKDLAAKGIKSIVTVDGAQPELEIAKKYGLRYVHIPVEYSGISRVDAIRIIRAVRDLPGPVFIHCHHGLHRGPAAAAMVAIALANYDNAKAAEALKQAGTGLNYKGLWKDVGEFKRPTKAEIDAARDAFVEKAPVPDMTAAMISIDDRSIHLKASRAANWGVPKDHPDIDPPHEAMLLREAYTELKRSSSVAKFPADFMVMLDSAEKNARELENALRGKDTTKAEVAMKALQADCTSCHRVYRDNQVNHAK